MIHGGGQRQWGQTCLLPANPGPRARSLFDQLTNQDVRGSTYALSHGDYTPRKVALGRHCGWENWGPGHPLPEPKEGLVWGQENQ